MTSQRLNPFKFRAMTAAAALVLSGSFLLAQDAAPAAGARTDGQIEMDVVHALDGSAALKNDLITAATIQGEVILSGTVASDADRQLAESIAAKVSGVSKVTNKLKVGNPAEDPNNVAPPQDDSAAPAAANNQQGDQNPPAYSSSPDQQYPSDQGSQSQQAENYPNQQPQARTPSPDMPPPMTPGQNVPPQGPGYARPGGNGPYYPQQPPPPGYGQQRQRYYTASGPITVLPGTQLTLRTNASLDEKHAKVGQAIDFVVIQDVAVQGYLAIPRGATVHGVVTESKHAGQLTGSPELALTAESLDIDGRTYPLQSDEFRVKGPSKTGRTVGNALGGALAGAIIGGAIGGGGGAAVGAVAGGGAGTALSAPGGPHAWIPAEALVTFHLNAPVTVDPVTQEEAMRLAQGLYPGGPQLYRRRGYYAPGYGPGYPPPPPGYYAGYGYPYGPVYYRPYYFSGGYYYWR